MTADLAAHELQRRDASSTTARTGPRLSCFDYTFSVIIKRTAEFDNWFQGLKDSVTRKRLALRLRKAELGNLGDTKPVGEGVFEMREFFGPGWRMYAVQRGQTLVVMLGGGDKSTQAADIARAVALSRTIEE